MLEGDNRFWLRPCIIMGIALTVRLAFLFMVVPIDFAWDSYHRWQIAYYTLHTGLKYGRMWDLFGMEYYWGILPELTEAFLLWLSKSSSLIAFRIFNATIGSASILLLYRICKKYFNERAAFALSLLAAICPPIVIWDTIALDGSLGVFFLLLSLCFYERRQYLCGVTLGLASMCRVEFYFVTLGLCLCYLVFERSGTKFIPAISGWLTAMGPYLWFLQTRTGDWLYQVRWNYLCSMGAWGLSPAWFSESLPWRVMWGIILFATILSLVHVYRKKPPNYIIWALFLGYTMFQGVVYTVSVTRYVALHDMLSIMLGLQNIRFVPNYMFAIILAPVLINKLRSAHFSNPLGRVKIKRGQVVSAVIVAFLFAAWLYADAPVCNSMSRDLKSTWWDAIDRSGLLSHYRGGTIIIDPGWPQVTYYLIQRGISHEHILGSLYCPEGERNQSLAWFRKENATWYIHNLGVSSPFPELDTSEDHPPFYIFYAEHAMRVYKISGES